MKLAKVYSDGGARGNPGPAAIGVMIYDAEGKVLKEHREVIGETTNNVAEYTGVLVGLDLAKQFGIEEVHFFGDSELVVRQLSGIYKVKTPHLQSLHAQIKKLEQHFKKVSYRQVPRETLQIKRVDKLVNQALDEAGY